MLAHCPHFQYFCYCFQLQLKCYWYYYTLYILYTYRYEWYINIYVYVCITLFFCCATALCVSSDSTKWYSRSMDSCRRTLALQDVNLFPVHRKKPFDMSECQIKCQTEWIYIYIYIIYIPSSSFVAFFSGRLYRLLTSFWDIGQKKWFLTKAPTFAIYLWFPWFHFMLLYHVIHIPPHPILFQLNSLMWAIDEN